MPNPVLVLDAPVGATEVAAFLPHLAAALNGKGPAILPLPAGPTSLRDRLVARADPTRALEHPDTALLVPTSGSTGEPKIAMLSRQALLASATATHFELGGPGRWLLTMPTTHIAGLQVLVRSVVSGFPPVALDLRDGFSVPDLIDNVGRLLDDIGPEPRYTAVVPTQLRRVLDAGGVAVSALVALDAVLLGGAAAPDDLVDAAHAAGITLVRTYGMTETCGGCVYDGATLPGVEVAISDDGRVQLAGPMLFSGYRGDTAQTTTVLQDGRLTTDDVGHLDEHGRLHIDGRADNTLLTGGVSVAPADVEHVLHKHTAVRQVVVVGVPDAEWGEQVTAVCVVSQPVTVDDLRAHARAELPEAALPRSLVTVDELPMLASGKPDRLAALAVAVGQGPA